MKFRTLLICILLAGIFTNCEAQESLPKNSRWTDTAEFYIRNVKALVVRLRTRSAAIEKLKSQGAYGAAINIDTIQRNENKEIVQAFREEFDFCKVYFMYADSTDALLNGKHSGIFLDDSLNISPAIEMKEDFFLIAEKGNAKQYIKHEAGETNVEETEHGYLNETIIILDPRLHQLKDPFPYYAQEVFPANVIGTSWSGKAKMLNNKFKAYYRKVVH